VRSARALTVSPPSAVYIHLTPCFRGLPSHPAPPLLITRSNPSIQHHINDTMSSKRNIEEVETSDSGPEPQSTADIAELLRQQLIKSASSKKQRRVRKRRAIDIDTIVPALSVSGFFKLPREVRDQISGLAWEASPRIRQQYKRKIYHVT
jgi:hypothetical protein